MSRIDSCCIIDDDEFFAFNTKKLMKQIGFCENVLWYADGQEAIDSLIGLLIENIPLPQIIFLDLNMPNKDGWAFLEEFQNIPKHQRENVKVYIVSSFVSPENMAKVQKYCTVASYLVKPLTADSLNEVA
ncbi:response regulator [Maribacter aurantiacus]|uniref:Response regulator n=1 Tax=Maribacter aurantiacus TaxID=1882343 RepID=A0A5R8MB39_9FLAO|nr:response regulator [Maribacter aurantiacus]TLF46720.1 response regulator [Maribacter aurantiacus]